MVEFRLVPCFKEEATTTKLVPLGLGGFRYRHSKLQIRYKNTYDSFKVPEGMVLTNENYHQFIYRDWGEWKDVPTVYPEIEE